MADSSISAHVVVATIAWTCLRMFSKSSEAEVDTGAQGSDNLSRENPLNAALNSWLSDMNSDLTNSVASKNRKPSIRGQVAGVEAPPGQDIDINNSSAAVHEEEFMENSQSLQNENGSRRSFVEMKVRIFLDFGENLQQDRGKLFIQDMKEDGYEDEIQIVPSSGTVLGTTVSVQKGVFAKLTRLLWRAIGIEKTSTLQVGSWGVFYKAGEQLRLLKFEDGHNIPEIHQVSQMAQRTLSIQGKHLEGADITAVANNKTVPLTVFWPREELARESEVLVATLPKECDGLHRAHILIIHAVKELVEDEKPILVRTESRLLELEQPLTLALRGLLELLSPRFGWLILILALLVGNFSSLLVNIFLNVPAVWMATWFFVQLLPEGTIMYLKTYCTKIWADIAAPATPEVDSHDAVMHDAPFDSKRSRNPEDISCQVPLYMKTTAIVDILKGEEDSTADSSDSTEMHSAHLSWNNLDSKENATIDPNVSGALLDMSARSSASDSSPRGSPPREVTVLVDREEINEDYNRAMQNYEASVSSNRDSGSIDAPTEVSWGNGSSQILLDNVSDAYSFPSIDDDDLIKFFPEKCEIEPAATVKPLPRRAVQSASTTSSPSRFSMRSLLSRLRANPPSTSSNSSSKNAVQTMSSVLISHRPDSASHTVVAAFDATRKLTFEAVDWGLLQMDLWPGDTLVVLGVITKIRSPLGIEVLADLNGFSGLNPRVLEHEIAQRLLDYQKKLLARRLYCQKKGLNLEVRITAGHPLRNVVAKEVLQLHATWVILDKHLEGPSRYCIQKCSSGVVLMNKKTNMGQFLRMAQQPSLTDPLYGGKYVKRQYTTAPIRFEDYHFEHSEGLDTRRHPLGSPGPSDPGVSPRVSSDSE